MSNTRIHEALRDAIQSFEQRDTPGGKVNASGTMRFASALEGPPGRLHGGHHAFVRTLPILGRLEAHRGARTFPCAVDVAMLQGLPLDEPVEFEATYRQHRDAWALRTRFAQSERLVAYARSLPEEPLLDPEELAHWRSLYDAISPDDESFEMFGFAVHIGKDLVWLASQDPLRNLPKSQHAALVEPDGTLGPAFACTQLDAVGAAARGTVMRHPHFTKRVQIHFASERVPAETHLICLADRTRIQDDALSKTAPVTVGEEQYGTVRVPVAMVDARFERVFATGIVTVHPVDPEKFEALRRMRQLRKDR